MQSNHHVDSVTKAAIAMHALQPRAAKSVNVKSANATDIAVGAKIQYRRKMLGMSQTVLGELLGVTFQQVQKYEKGMNRIGAGRLEKIAGILGVPVAHFFDQEGVVETKSPAVKFMNSVAGVELNKAMAQIKDPKVVARIVAMAKAIAKAED